MDDPFASSPAVVLRMLDERLEDKSGSWWDAFYENRAKPIPFFVAWPDENLVEWFERGLIPAGRVLELGCGNGRNAIFLACQGCDVDAVDFSAEAIAWATECAASARVRMRFQCASIFEADIEEASYDFVYDHGCFHHIAPHRRKAFVDLVTRALKPGGRFGLACFRPEGGGGLTDREVYEQRTLAGGIGYSRERLLELWQGPLEIVELRQMRELDGEAELYGKDFLWVMLGKKPASLNAL